MHDKLQAMVAEHFYESPETVLACYFERHTDTLQSICESARDGEVRRSINEEYRDAVEATWKERSFAIKTRVAYSDAQYMRLKHMLGGTYDEDEDCYTDLIVNGVRAPNLASLRHMHEGHYRCTKEGDGHQIVREWGYCQLH